MHGISDPWMLHPMPSWACCLQEYISCVGGPSEEGIIMVMIGLALDSVQFMLDIRVEVATT